MALYVIENIGCEHRSPTHQSANQNIVTLNMKGAKTARQREDQLREQSKAQYTTHED